jgi:hypothetical protein
MRMANDPELRYKEPVLAAHVGGGGAPNDTIRISKIAHLIFEMLQDCGANAVVSGEPDERSYFDGELIDGVLLDGMFDLTKMAKSLLEIIDK